MITTLGDLFQKIFRGVADAAKIRLIFRILAISLAILHTWAAITRESMNPDGICYLDIGDAYFRGDWENAVNPVWPPLYSWVLGLVNLFIRPQLTREFPTVHLVDFVIFLGTLACFEYLWFKLEGIKLEQEQAELIPLPNWAWWAIGYSLFIWISLNLIQVWAVTPDMLMAGLVFLVAGQIIEIRRDSNRWRPFLLLGLFLGLGYLSKTFMFSMSLVFLGICLALVKKSWKSIVKVLATSGIFLLISVPFILAISKEKGRFTIGEVGLITYIRHVVGYPLPQFQGDPDNQIILDHPTRLIHSTPPIYEFGEPIGGTYPLSIDPSFWYEGLEIPFNIKNQMARLLISSTFYLDLFINKQGIVLACVVALYIFGEKKMAALQEIGRKWVLVFPSIIAFILYGLLLVLGRYVAVFLMLFWADLFANIRLPRTNKNRLVMNGLSILMVLGIQLNVLAFNLDGIARLDLTSPPEQMVQLAAGSARPSEVAIELKRLNIAPGSRVGVIGYGFDSFWARLARVKIVAEMPETRAGDFWFGSAALQEGALQAFANSGVEAVVAENVPQHARLDGWHQVGGSNYYIYVSGVP